MNKLLFLILGITVCLASGQRGLCKNTVRYTVEKSIDIQQSQSGWNRTPPVRLQQQSATYPTKKAAEAAMAEARNPGLPATPMGAAIRQPGDYLYQKRPGGTTKQVREGKGLVGLPDTRMGAAVGMATDSIGKQSKRASSYNSLGLPSANLGATVGKPGDAIRSDLRNNGYKRFPSRRPGVSNPVNAQPEQPASTTAATYGEYDGTKKRNY